MLSNFLGLKSSLSRRLITYLILCSSALTLLLTLFQLYRDYQADLALAVSNYTQIEEVHLSAITESVWTTDAKNLKTIAGGISNLRDINYIAIVENGETLVAFGIKPSTKDTIRSFPLIYQYQDISQTIGKLDVAIDIDAINQRIIDKALVILISNAVKTSIIALIMALIIFHLIVQHLTHISQFLVKFNIDGPLKNLELNRPKPPPGNEDELDLVTNSINHFLIENRNHISEIKEAQDDLLTQNQITSNMLEAAFLTRASDATIVYTNPAFDVMFGYEPNEVIGRPVSILNSPTDLSPEEITEKIHLELKTHSKWQGEIFSVKKDGTVFWSSVNMSTFYHPVYGDVWISVNSDATERIQAQQKLKYQASHDTLTGLMSRYEFEQRVTRLLSGISEDKTEHAMCFLDLDQFKIINDSCGHAAGDELLRQLGRLLGDTVRSSDALARLGGDEFGVLMEYCTLEQANRIANDILELVMDYRFFWDGKAFRIGVSIGLVAITKANSNYIDLFKQADAACYLAKDMGRNRIHAYHPDDTELAIRHGEMQWVGRINQALDEDRLCLYAQPIVALDGSGLRHYELLVRMLDNKGGVIPPGAFLPAAERYNLIEKIDAWVIRHACASLAKCPRFIDNIDFITINLSGPSLTNESLLESIFHTFEQTGISPEKVCFEVTETVAVSNLNSAIDFIQKLKGAGCRFALDDFGSGLSSFGYLKNLPVDYLKIDGMFVKDMVDDPIDRAMVKSINEIGHVMGMKTIAEFVENDAIKEMLKEVGVDYAQGYGLGKPEPLTDLIAQSNKS